MPAWLVTGGSGFLGRCLLDTLEHDPPPDAEVWALGRRCPRGWNAQRFVAADLTDFDGLRAVLSRIEPAVVLHAAGRTPPAQPDELYRGNTLATALLLETLGQQSRETRVVLAGSAAELGPVDVPHLPVDESYSCHPVDAYGASKYLASVAGLAANPPLQVVVGRVFNPIGPGMPESQALGRFAALLADPETVRLSVGCLETRRDFIDVRDVARALIALAERGQPGLVYHVGTGRSNRVGDGLERLIGLSERTIAVERDPRIASNSGPLDSRADIGRIVAHTGWQPQVAWEQSLRDLWDAACGRGSH
jgi:GDP-4-dehydro-6-deoxy-D-mannose reductase